VSRSFAPRIAQERKAFEEMQELCKATPVATVEILHKDVEDNSYVEKIESFLVRIGNLNTVL
jgi:pentose-5-phosphate-3-epimerase